MSYAFKKRCSQIRQISSCLYNGLFKGRTNYRARSRVAIFIHETIPCQKITLNPPLQAKAARNNIEKDVTAVSIYNSRSHDRSKKLLSTPF